MSLKAVAALMIGTLIGACSASNSGTSDVYVPLPTARIVATSQPAAIMPTTSAPSPPTNIPLPSTMDDQQAPLPTTPVIHSRFLPLAIVAAPPPTDVIAPALALPSPTVPGDEIAAREAQLVAAINQVRVANNLPPYLHSPVLSVAARAHSCDLAAHTMISHTSSDGRTLAERLAGSDPPWEWPSESIAAGTDDPATVVAWWMDEPPEGWHRRNILDPDQREVGVGYCYTESDSTGNHHYWTADFSRHPGE